MELYLQSGNEQLGPYSMDQIAGMLENGEIHGETPAWYEGLEDWKPLGELIEIETVPQAESSVAPANVPQPMATAAPAAPQGMMTKASGLIQMRNVQIAIVAIILVVLGIVLWPKGDPAEQLATRIEIMDELLQDHMDNPKEGMEKMISSFEKHGPETVKLIMELGIELAQIEDDEERKERMKEVAETLKDPIENLMESMEEFQEAAWDDEGAQKVTQEYMERWMAVGENLMELTVNQTFKAGADRSAVIMTIRNCQQAMRGEENMKQLSPGDPFTREDLEEYMMFPEDIETPDGWIRFEAGTRITPQSGDPATNDDHIWLKVTGPGMDGVVGKYGFDSIEETTGW